MKTMLASFAGQMLSKGQMKKVKGGSKYCVTWDTPGCGGNQNDVIEAGSMSEAMDIADTGLEDYAGYNIQLCPQA
jgi:hypothetical protein